jgi:mannose-1-phosphate guanylyltransferase
MNTYAVIMAGGVGSRFWPESRQAHPKQFLRVLGEDTLIQNTIQRLNGLIPPERCFVVTHERYVQQTRDQLPAVPEENILAEPISRNTAPCIAYAAARLKKLDPEGVMVVLPADHVIRNVRHFHEVLRVAIDQAREPGSLVTIGVQPTHPETGYGYVQFDSPPEGLPDTPRAYRVLTFAEKPDIGTAERFLDSGDFLWNSGMFIWRVDSILDQLRRHLPDAYDAFDAAGPDLGTEREPEAVSRAFSSCPRISIDYGVMERADSVYVVPGSFGWSDVGDWRAVYELSDKDDAGNTLVGHAIVHDSSRCYVQGRERLVVLVGIHDAVVVDTRDAVLICHRESTQQVKNIVDYLNSHQFDSYV